jgi:hypothetical protein
MKIKTSETTAALPVESSKSKATLNKTIDSTTQNDKLNRKMSLKVGAFIFFCSSSHF